jgi:hypothetical protein
VHDPAGQHLQLVELADEADVAQRTATSAHLLFFPTNLKTGSKGFWFN